MSKKRPKGHPERLASLLGVALKGTTLGERIKELEIWRSWEKIVGPAIAGRARPLRVSGGVLTVVVGSAPWMQQLTFMKSDLKQRINHCLGDEKIRDIIFRSGKVLDAADESEGLQTTLRELTAEERDIIESQAEGLTDKELGKQFKMLMESYYRRRSV